MNPLYNILVYVVWFCATYYSVVFYLMLLTEKDRLYRKMPLFAKSEPLVSVILPAFNEEEKIAKTIESLKKTAYHNI